MFFLTYRNYKSKVVVARTISSQSNCNLHFRCGKAILLVSVRQPSDSRRGTSLGLLFFSTSSRGSLLFSVRQKQLTRKHVADTSFKEPQSCKRSEFFPPFFPRAQDNRYALADVEGRKRAQGTHSPRLDVTHACARSYTFYIIFGICQSKGEKSPLTTTDSGIVCIKAYRRCINNNVNICNRLVPVEISTNYLVFLRLQSCGIELLDWAKVRTCSTNITFIL